MKIETARLIITEFTLDMVPAVQALSLDEDNRRFVPDEVFETLEDARDTVSFLMEQYGESDAPLVYPMLEKASGRNVGHVQIVPLEDGAWEVGYHVGKPYTGRGYATEAVEAFLPVLTERLGLNEVFGICDAENQASRRVLEKCHFRLIFLGESEYQGEERNVAKYVWEK